jgi:hypothetical protein
MLKDRAKRPRSLSSWLILACALVVAAPAAADPDPPAPPRVILQHGDDFQRGRDWFRNWKTYLDNGGCLVRKSEGPPTIGPALHVGSGRQWLRFRFRTSYRPDRVEMVARTIGDSTHQYRDLAFRLMKDKHPGRTRWVAVSRPLIKAEIFIKLRAYWKDGGPCRRVDRVGWTFNVAP